MLNKIIRFSLENRILVLVASVLLVIGGLYSTSKTDVDVFPDLNAPTVVIMTEAGGMATEEVEQLVTFPIETAVNGSTGVRRVRSQSTNGFSVVWVEFDWGTDIYLARQIVSEKLAAVGEQMPAGVSAPVLGPQSSILGEVLIVSLTSKHTSQQDLRTYADWVIRPRLLSTGGVAQVSVHGGDIKEYQILVSPGRMKHFGVSLTDIMACTRGMNTNTNGGVQYKYGNEYIIRGITSTNDVEKLGTCIVKKNGESVVTLADVADIKIGNQSPKLGVASERAQSAVLLTVTKQPNTSTIDLTKHLDLALADLKQTLPADVHISTDIFRQSDFIESSIDNVQKSLIEGAIFVVIILMIFLANVRTTVISLVTIPISFLVAMIVLNALGISINTMTLGGLAIAIGSLVDDAIVDVENVYKHIRQNRALPEAERVPIIELVYNASREVRMPILNSTLIIVVSFAPLFFLSGMEGRMLIPLGIAFVTALFASTLVALTLTPVLCSYLLGKSKGELPKEAFVAVWLKKYYERALLWVLANTRKVIVGTAALFVVAVGVFFCLGSSFLPKFNEGSFTINISSLPGISLEESDSIGARAERLLLQVPEIKTVARKTGRAELDEHALGVNVSEIEAPFELKDRSHEEVLNDVRKRLSVLAGANIEIGQPISHRIDAMLSGTQASIAIKLFGTDLNRMFTIGNQIKNACQDIEGIADLNVEQQIERPELKIVPRRELLVRNGITLPEFNEFLAVNLAGETVSQVYEAGRAFNLVVKAADYDEISNLIIDTQDGRKVPLCDVADIISSAGPNTINRENVQRKIVISANTSGRALSDVVADIKQAVGENVQLPEGYHVEYGGQFESQESASRVLYLTCMLAIVVIFFLLFMQFRNALEAGIILLNLPLALIGGIFAIVLTTGEVSIPAVIGFISLFGIATRNGMLLITEYKRLRTEEGKSVREAIVEGSLSRLNPILMTALTSALALVPLALGGDLPGVHEIAEIRPHRAAHEGILRQGHGQPVGGEHRGQQLVKGHAGTQGGDTLRRLVGAVDVVLRQRRDVLRGRRMGGDEQGGGHGLDPLQCGEIGVHVVQKGDAVLVQRLPGGQAVRQIHHVVRRAEAHHIQKVSRQGQQLPALRQYIRRQGRGVALLCHQELVPQRLGRAAAVQQGGLQHRAAGDVLLHAGGVDGAAGLLLQVLVAADVVGVGMGVDDCGQLPALCIQNFLDFSAGILIVSAVDQPDIVITYAINADFGRSIDVIGIFCDLHQFIHGQNLLCFCFCGTLSHALQGDNPLDLICKNCVFARNY